MALFTRRGLCETFYCLKDLRRFRGKVNVRKPRAFHFQKALYLEFAKPWFLSTKKGKTATELCRGQVEEKKKDDENPLQRFIAQDLYDYFKKSKLVVFYHHNPATGNDEEFRAFAMFKKENMHFKKYGRKTMAMAIQGTPYEAVLDFYVSQNIILFSPEPDIKKVLKISKKFPHIVILAAILEGKFINKDDLIKYSEIPNIQTAQASLLATLTGIGSQLANNLTAHQQVLVSHLDQRLKQLEPTE